MDHQLETASSNQRHVMTVRPPQPARQPALDLGDRAHSAYLWERCPCCGDTARVVNFGGYFRAVCQNEDCDIYQ